MEGLDEEYPSGQQAFQSGGSDNDRSFVSYMTSFSSTEKAQMLNIGQYCGISIIPLLAVLKIMKIYMPVNNPLKPTSELVFEVILQLVVILVAFFFIHKLVLYFPTYSQVNYENFSLLSGMLPLLFLMFTLDTKISEKLNVLFDRLLEMIGIIKEPMDSVEDDKTDSSSQGQVGGQQIPDHTHAVAQNSHPAVQTGAGGMPATTSIEEMCGMSGGTNGGFEPVPANW